MKRIAFNLALLILITAGCKNISENNRGNIKPYEKNKAYWQYAGKPVTLLGASGNDNIFQDANVKSHLDSLSQAGGNYIRNTMSDRDSGNVHAFFMNPDGKYDLNQWNPEYWSKFENMIRIALERDIIVQIEVWDRFDHSREFYLDDPYNPGNNINYTYSESGLDSVYPLHPGQNKQPFFFSVPELDNNTVILKYQQLFVDKLLAITLNYGNILYCIDNETSGKEEWATYWAEYIRSVANDNNKEVYITEMWDEWDVKTETHKRTLDHPERYDYIDISQNSQIAGPDNWNNSQYVLDYVKEDPRPVNSTKIYGSDSSLGSWLNRGINTEHAVNSFFRNIIGGFASSRFHRPPHGLGLSEISINCIRTVRNIETTVKMWDIKPRMDLLQVEEDVEAYLAADEGKHYVIFFAGKGSVKLDLRDHEMEFNLQSIDINSGNPGEDIEIRGGDYVTIDGNRSVVVLSKK
jgi:hypothetical protein